MERTARSRRGNMLALVGATTFVIVAIILFAMWYVSMSMGSTAHRTAIESAALAAATDLGRVTIQTPECGYVSLTGCPPIGSGTLAPDGYYRQVHSINELIATNRLDMIIADVAGDTKLKALAVADNANIMAAKDKLVTALKAACNGTAQKDANGNVVTPYDTAFNLYMSNQAVKSSYVQGTFKLTLGEITDNGIATAISVPQPQDNRWCDPSQQINGCYRSDMNIPYDNVNFVLGAVSRQPSLVDMHKFATSVPGLPYAIPCAVQVTAVQQFDNQGIQTKTTYTACATAGGVFRAATPGAFTISFPDGPMDEMVSPQDCITGVMKDGKKIDKDIHCNVKEAIGGDYPIDAPTGCSMVTPAPDWRTPVDKSTAGDCFRVCLYDWMRSCGSVLQTDDVKHMLDKPFDAPSSATVDWYSLDIAGNPYFLGPVPRGILHIYECQPNGSILYKHKDVQPDPYLVVANQQMYAENNETLASKGKEWQVSVTITAPSQANPNPSQHMLKGKSRWDVYYRNEIHHLGLGKHDGEPCDADTISSKAPTNSLAWSNDYGAGGKGAGHMEFYPRWWDNNIDNWVDTRSSAGLPPMLSDMEDFALTQNKPLPDYIVYSKGPSGGAPRPTYTEYGIATEIRYRRQVDIKNLNFLIGDMGYIGLMTQPVAGATQGVSVDPTDTATGILNNPNVQDLLNSTGTTTAGP